jgi:methionine-gamma-lyase
MTDANQSIRDIQHFGEEGGVVPVIDVAATSTFMDPENMEKVFNGELQGCYLYSRHSNPTVTAFGKKLAALEGAEAALGVSSGMAAIYCTIRQLMPQGGHLIASRTIYGGTYALFANVIQQCGVEVSFVDTSQISEIEKAVRPNTKILYVETMSNPLLKMADLPALKKVAVAKNLKLVVDNTFTPVLVRPIDHGADVVIHSCTKYISGASDMIAGAIAGSQEFINQLIDINFGMVMLTGPAMDARIAHELYLRLDHLPIRMQAHSTCAANLSKALAQNDVPHFYPGLGGMMTVNCGTSRRAFQLADRLQKEKFGLYAVSLGFSRTLMSCPAVSTSSEIPENERKEMGLSEGLLRLSIGFIGEDKTMADRFLKCWRSLQ